MTAIKSHFRQYSPPTEEELNFKLSELRHLEEPFAEPLHLVEQAVSLACSLCFLWTRRLGSNVTLAVLDDRNDLPVRFDSGSNLRQLMPLMERLALVRATPQFDVKRIQHELEHQALPAGPVILITPGTTAQANTLTRSLSRQMQTLDMSKPHQMRRFFTSQAKAVLHDMPDQKF